MKKSFFVFWGLSIFLLSFDGHAFSFYSNSKKKVGNSGVTSSSKKALDGSRAQERPSVDLRKRDEKKGAQPVKLAIVRPFTDKKSRVREDEKSE